MHTIDLTKCRPPVSGTDRDHGRKLGWRFDQGTISTKVQPAPYQAMGRESRVVDAFIFVAPEYNHGISAALKNAIDVVYAEWNSKVAAFVNYGSAGGVRAVESLRVVMSEIQIAEVRAQVML